MNEPNMLLPLPNLKGVATDDLVSQVQAGTFKADYINWSRTMQLLRDNAPGWMPILYPAPDGGYVHRAPVGGFLMIGFVHQNGQATPAITQAIMDNRNAAVPWDRIDARDVTDTHVRGICKAAALTFGLAYELWAKMPLESGYAEKAEAPPPNPEPPPQRDLGRRMTVAQHSKAMREAKDDASLKRAFALAWKQHENPTDPKAHTEAQLKLKEIYDERAAQLAAESELT